MFDLKFGVYNSSTVSEISDNLHYLYDMRYIRCQYSIGLELGLWLGLMYK